MEYNPHTQKHHRLKQVLETSNSEKRSLSDELYWFDSTDISSLYFSFDGKEQAKNNIQLLITTGEKEIKVLNAKIQEAISRTKTLLNPLNWFNEKQKIYRKKLNELKKKLNSKEENNKLMVISLAKMNQSINKYKKEIDKHKKFDQKKVNDEIESLSQKIDSLEKEIKQIYVLKKNVDIKLQPILSQMEDFESKISEAEGGISRAQSFERDLEHANNSYERAIIHEKCERVLNDGSPKKIIKQQERTIARLKRDLEKAKKRAMQIGEKASRMIEKIVIDGNNMCYDGNEFVGLSPLIKSTYKLQKKYQVIVVFDSAIRYQIKANDKTIETKFNNNTKVHIVATKQLADETVLDIASGDELCYIISNDRFGEYKEKEVVINNRLIRHEIVAGKVIIHDFDINEKYR